MAILIGMNNIVTFNDTSDGFSRRFKVIPFKTYLNVNNYLVAVIIRTTFHILQALKQNALNACKKLMQIFRKDL